MPGNPEINGNFLHCRKFFAIGGKKSLKCLCNADSHPRKSSKICAGFFLFHHG
jgi:hypothetical protein